MYPYLGPVSLAVRKLKALAPSAQDGETVREWIAYADKLEKVIALCAKSSVDNLTRLHAEDGLRVVSHSRPERGA